MFDVQKKWTIIVSYGGATEDMKLAICFRHDILVYLQYRSPYLSNLPSTDANRVYHVSYTPAGETGSKITSIKH